METATIIIKPSWGETLELFQKNGAIRISSPDAETFKNLLNSINLKYNTEEDTEKKLTRFVCLANQGE